MPLRLAWSVLLIFACAVPSAFAGDDYQPHKYDWPQWQGPQRTGISQETGLLKAWPKNGPPLVWKVNNGGEGFVTPSIAAGRTFLMGNIDDNEFVICLREKDGDTLWKATVGPVRSDGGGHPGPR